MLTAADMFCGAGGSSLGAELTGKVKLVLGLNHWPRAIETHSENFKHAEHDCADISALTTRKIAGYPDTDLLLASPECTNHSLAKGALRRKPQASSLFDDGPAGDQEQDRSRATMWDVPRFAEQKLLKGKPYKAIIIENVPDAFKWGYNDDGGLFNAWRLAMDALGYASEIVWLNSMFAYPTPQSRDRMYVVFWLKGGRKPNLKIEPPSWCPECECVVAGQQAFKKLDNPWGRYGPQYVYICPDCRKTVLPAAAPAATAIDFDVHAERIGDRDKPLAKNTIDRIRRGLERLSTEPFAIRLLQSGHARPLTLPLVTLTQRHDLAMIMPIAGNTFERTPGNRARDADRQPLDTVHGTLDRALVIPMATGGGHGRPAESTPVPTLHAQGGTVGVVALRKHGDLKNADIEPVHSFTAGGFHHAVVMRNNNHAGDPGSMVTSDLEPIRTLATKGHQSVVFPYDSTGNPREAEYEPVPTLSTHDRVCLVVPPTIKHDDPPPPVKTISDTEIDDCRFRMFELGEIAQAMQMHEHVDGGEYVVTGNKRERMAQYGNAVTPPVMRILVDRVAESLDEKGS